MLLRSKTPLKCHVNQLSYWNRQEMRQYFKALKRVCVIAGRERKEGEEEEAREKESVCDHRLRV